MTETCRNEIKDVPMGNKQNEEEDAVAELTANDENAASDEEFAVEMPKDEMGSDSDTEKTKSLAKHASKATKLLEKIERQQRRFESRLAAPSALASQNSPNLKRRAGPNCPNAHFRKAKRIKQASREEENVPSRTEEDYAKERAQLGHRYWMRQYISTTKGFSGIIKELASDFVVHEIAPDGEIASLEASDLLTLPEFLKQELEKAKEPDWENAASMVNREELETNGHFKTKPIFDKADRTKVHLYFHDTRYVTTVDRESFSIIIRDTSNMSQGERRRNRKRCACHRFVMKKINKESQKAIGLLGTSINMKNTKRVFAIAGTKDKRATTYQFVTAKTTNLEALVRASDRFAGIKIGKFQSVSEPLRLGDLQGNRFEIRITHIEGLTQADYQEGVRKIKEHGFINYYGLQRFGKSTKCRNPDVGDLILKHRYEVACHRLMADHDGAAKRAIENALKKQPNDFEGALKAIPRNLFSLYTHAWQALIWNRATTDRISRYGLRVVVGDLVRVSGAKTPTSDSDEAPGCENVIVVTSEEHASQFRLTDVVLPLPGDEVIFPEHSLDEKYFTKISGGPLWRGAGQRLGVFGTYREILVRPVDFEILVEEQRTLATLPDQEGEQAEEVGEGEDLDMEERGEDGDQDEEMQVVSAASEVEPVPTNDVDGPSPLAPATPVAAAATNVNRPPAPPLPTPAAATTTTVSIPPPSGPSSWSLPPAPPSSYALFPAPALSSALGVGGSCGIQGEARLPSGAPTATDVASDDAQQDPDGPKQLLLRFTLGSGQYATMLLREFAHYFF